MKKKLGLIVGALLVASTLLAGCGQKPAGQEAAVATQETKATATATPTPAAEPSTGKPLEVAWGQQIGSPEEDICVSIAVDGKGNSISAGYTKGDVGGKNMGSRDILVAAFDGEGKKLWVLQEGTAAEDAASFVVLDEEGNGIITGVTKGKLSGAKGTGSIFVQKIGKDGKILWTKQLGADATNTSNGIHLDKDGNIYIAGSTTGFGDSKPVGGADAFAAKLDKNGNLEWIKTWGTSLSDVVNGLEIDDEGSIYAVGDTIGDLDGKNNGESDIFVSKLDKDGTLLFTKQIGTKNQDVSTKVLVDGEKSIYLAGWTMGTFAEPKKGQGDSVFMKLSATGDLLWKHQFGTPLWDGIHSMVFSKENSMDVIVGGCQNFDKCQAFLRKYDTNGNELWKKELIPAFSTCGREIGIDDLGNIYQIGGTHGQLYSKEAFQGKESDMFIYKTNEK